jgi:hypothetical protein
MVKLMILGICLLALGLYFLKWKWNHRKNKEVNIDDLLLELQPYDFIVSWGTGFTTFIVSVLEYLKDGVYNPPTHNAHVYKNGMVASAESKGYILLDAKNFFTDCSNYVIYRFKNVNDSQKKLIDDLTIKYQGKKYDYSMYIVDALRIFLVFISIYFIFIGHKIAIFVFIGLLLIYIPGMRLLKKWESNTSACSETESLIYSTAEMIKLTTDHLTITPYNTWNILENRDDAAVVLDSRK